MSILPSVFGLKGMGIALAAGLAIGGVGGGWTAYKLSDAKVLRIEKAQQDEKIKSLNEVIAQHSKDDLMNARLTAGVQSAASNVAAAITEFQNGMTSNEEAPPSAADSCDRYSDPDFERVRSSIARGANLGDIVRQGSAARTGPQGGLPAAGRVPQ
jgi:hypothetical protein